MTKKAIPFKKLAFFLFVVAAISACKKTSSTPAPVVTPPATVAAFTFKVDGGDTIKVDSANALLYTTAAGRQVDVYVYKGGSEVLEFHFSPSTGSKTADTILGTGAFLTYLETPVKSFDSQSGTLNITTCDTVGNKLEGDFNFVGKQYPYTTTTVTHTITAGHMLVTVIRR